MQDNSIFYMEDYEESENKGQTESNMLTVATIVNW